MKATKEQQKMIRDTFTEQLAALNLAPAALTGIADCWVLFHRFERSMGPKRPLGTGTARDWLFPGLNDSHLETVFRSYLREHKGA